MGRCYRTVVFYIYISHNFATLLSIADSDDVVKSRSNNVPQEQLYGSLKSQTWGNDDSKRTVWNGFSGEEDVDGVQSRSSGRVLDHPDAVGLLCDGRSSSVLVPVWVQYSDIHGSHPRICIITHTHTSVRKGGW